MRYILGFIACFFLVLSVVFKLCDPGSHHMALASEHVSVKELAEHFNTCVQAYTRTARPIARGMAEARCNCAGEYLSLYGYGESSFRAAQKACLNP